MQHVAHEARLNTRREDGSTERAHVQHFAEKGEAWALARLAPRPFPYWLAYLPEWHAELLQFASEGMNGRAIAWPDIVAWRAAMHRAPSPSEILAIGRLEAIRLNPGAFEARDNTRVVKAPTSRGYPGKVAQ